jgi:bacillithiol system protein YtxJ
VFASFPETPFDEMARWIETCPENSPLNPSGAMMHLSCFFVALRKKFNLWIALIAASKLRTKNQIGESSVRETVTSLHSIEELNQAIAESQQHPVLIFKHSSTCPISGRALREFQKYLDAADPAVSYHLITVQTDRSVSNEVETRLQIQHETPQVILIKNEKEIWNASHFQITASAIEKAIQELTQ